MVDSLQERRKSGQSKDWRDLASHHWNGASLYPGRYVPCMLHPLRACTGTFIAEGQRRQGQRKRARACFVVSPKQFIADYTRTRHSATCIMPAPPSRSGDRADFRLGIAVHH